MCILAIKTKGALTPNSETLKEMYTRNPDGSGIAYNKDNKVIIKKGFMTFEEFEKATKEIPVDSVALIHCRISTSGGITKGLTHPYPISNDIKKLTTLTLKSEDVAIAHNGVFYGYPAKAGQNDTMQYIASIIYPLHSATKETKDNILMSTTFDNLIEKTVDNSRVAIIDKHGNYKKYGNGWIYDNGVWYSNNTYKKYEYTYLNDLAYTPCYKNKRCVSLEHIQKYIPLLAKAIEQNPDEADDIVYFYNIGYSAKEIALWYGIF